MKSNLNNKTKTILALAIMIILLGAWSCEAEEVDNADDHQRVEQFSKPELIPWTERKEAFDAVTAKIASMTETDKKKAAEEMLAFLKTQKAFVKVGMADDYSNIWGMFRDGTVLNIPNHQIFHKQKE